MRLWWNIFNFDQNENPTDPVHSFYVVSGGCTNSCGRDYWQYQDFEGNSYWRAGTPASGPLFCKDKYAYAMLSSQPSDGSCPSVPSKKNPLVWMSFDQPNGVDSWQHGQPPYPPGPPVNMNEDIGEDGTRHPAPARGIRILEQLANRAITCSTVVHLLHFKSPRPMTP